MKPPVAGLLIGALAGPAAIVTQRDPGDEVRIGLRVSLQRYLRH